MMMTGRWATRRAVASQALTRSLQVHIGTRGLPGELVLVPGAVGLVVFAQDRSCAAERPRNRLLAEVLHDYRLSTLMFDLLGDDEAVDPAGSDDVELLHRRLESALQWLQGDAQVGQLRLGLLGSCAGAAAALLSAGQHPATVSAVVSRGGRPELASAGLPRVQAATLLIVGGDDRQVLALNRGAMRALRCEARLEVMPRVSRRFDGPGVTETVAHLAGSWFANHLPPRLH